MTHRAGAAGAVWPLSLQTGLMQRRGRNASPSRSAARPETGFTLIELLIVILILGILAGIVVFAVGGITDRGTSSACKTDYNTLVSAEEAYYAKTTALGRVYGTPDDLVADHLLAARPRLHDVVLGPGDTSYDVTDIAGSGCTPSNDT